MPTHKDAQRFDDGPRGALQEFMADWCGEEQLKTRWTYFETCEYLSSCYGAVLSGSKEGKRLAALVEEIGGERELMHALNRAHDRGES